MYRHIEIRVLFYIVGTHLYQFQSCYYTTLKFEHFFKKINWFVSNIVSERKLMASSSMNLFVIGAINSQDLNICTVNHSSIQTFCSFTLYLRYGFWRWLMPSLWFLNVIKKGFDPNIIYSLQIKFKSYLEVFFNMPWGTSELISF